MAANSGYIITVSFAITVMALSLISVQTASITLGLVAAKNESSKPDSDCFFNPNGLAKCKPDPITGKCPSGFSANDKGNCFPKGPCPSGYVRKDNDESGTCFPQSNISKKENIIIAEAQAKPKSRGSSSGYQSGYSHGISDARKENDPKSWYILQPEKGFAFHTHDFINGYVDGFCSIAGPHMSSDSDKAGWDCSRGSSSAFWVSHGQES
jgi:hypothetical protein